MEEKEEVKVEAPFAVAGVTLIPIVKTSLKCWQGKKSLSCFGIKQPVSLVVVSPQARKAFRISGEEISLDQLTEEVPGVEEILDRI
jgi:hypothetical protein